jgi:hypothetical protein
LKFSLVLSLKISLKLKINQKLKANNKSIILQVKKIHKVLFWLLTIIHLE